MMFDAKCYGPEVARILALDGNGARPRALEMKRTAIPEAVDRLSESKVATLFPNAFSPQGAMCGLWSYFGCFDEAHEIAQALSTVEGSYWHGILHRQEFDPANAAYWFRRVGHHAIYPALAEEARMVHRSLLSGEDWDPFRFIDFCEQVRREPDSPDGSAAKQVALTEWQLLFDFCARPL